MLAGTIQKLLLPIGWDDAVSAPTLCRIFPAMDRGSLQAQPISYPLGSPAFRDDPFGDHAHAATYFRLSKGSQAPIFDMSNGVWFRNAKYLGMDFREWLIHELERSEPGTKAALARALGRKESAISGIMNRTREIKASEIPTIIQFLGKAPAVDPPHLGRVDEVTFINPIRVVGRVAAGVWRQVETVDHAEAEHLERSVFPPDPRYPIDAQFDLIVEGSSLDRVARDGARLRCVYLDKTGLEIRDGDLVVVRRIRDSHLCETTAKVYRRGGAGREELWPNSDDPRWQKPLVFGSAELSGEEIQIFAIALYAYTPTHR